MASLYCNQYFCASLRPRRSSTLFSTGQREGRKGVRTGQRIHQNGIGKSAYRLSGPMPLYVTPMLSLVWFRRGPQQNEQQTAERCGEVR
jgi:hypothetical protein